eukprot:TRINITY_DN7267_c1_g1_i2.p2 TRINITY_DN7267_c1_g1~~TRINITY_DN7267_c1_g1_i2.p2  ORF type:complete len:230 (+),score=78.60 TRINITY_DN7267_c1_g1_i2:226-915(+)
MTLWWYQGDDTFSALGRAASNVGAAERLLGAGGSDGVYHSHSKLMLKEPRQGGAWEWHQDFAYWYDQGLTWPAAVLTMFVAIDDNTLANGCMRVAKGSHLAGRLQHGEYGTQAMADPQRLEEVLKRCDVVPVVMRAGDALFMHSCTLHTSAANLSDHWRRNVAVAYNSRYNEPLNVPGSIGQPMYSRIAVLPDSDVKGRGVRTLSEHCPARNFLRMHTEHEMRERKAKL